MNEGDLIIPLLIILAVMIFVGSRLWFAFRGKKL